MTGEPDLENVPAQVQVIAVPESGSLDLLAGGKGSVAALEVFDASGARVGLSATSKSLVTFSAS
jgi:hypothetical protein